MTWTTWEEAAESLDELLDEGGNVTIAGMEFQPSGILRKLDPIAYRETLLNYIDAEGIDSDDLEGDMP